MSSLPILFFHCGKKHPYVPLSINQAEFSNPESEIFLIGDNPKNGGGIAHHLEASDYFKTAEEFSRIYRHLSTQPITFELRCFQRWYIFLEVMERQRMKEALICDSDTMLFHDFSSLSRQNPKKICGLSVLRDQNNLNWNACPHIAYWRIEALRKFCAFNSRLFQTSDPRLDEKWQYHKKEKLPGGLCDMNTLYLFYSELANDKKINFLRISNDSTVDLNIGSATNYEPEEFRMRGGHKKIIFHDGLPYGLHLSNQSEIKFKALHFQGNNKWMMPHYYQAGDQLKARFKVFARYGLRGRCREFLKYRNVRP